MCWCISPCGWRGKKGYGRGGDGGGRETPLINGEGGGEDLKKGLSPTCGKRGDEGCVHTKGECLEGRKRRGV